MGEWKNRESISEVLEIIVKDTPVICVMYAR